MVSTSTLSGSTTDKSNETDDSSARVSGQHSSAASCFDSSHRASLRCRSHFHGEVSVDRAFDRVDDHVKTPIALSTFHFDYPCLAFTSCPCCRRQHTTSFCCRPYRDVDPVGIVDDRAIGICHRQPRLDRPLFSRLDADA